MYRVGEPVGMGFSLKPPAWLRNLVSKAVNVSGQAQQAVSSVASNYPPGQTPSPNDPGDLPNSTPSWLLPVGIGAVVLLLVMRKRG